MVKTPTNRSKHYYKRAFDLFGAWTGGIVLSPLFLAVAAGCAVCHRGRILFAQERVGKAGVRFRMWKFRTMNDRRDARGELLPDDERMTGFGTFLRRTSLDELPQIFHVIGGKMSLVGPRPLLPEHVADCTPAENRRHAVRPGLTGLAQIRGRDTIPFSSRFRYDVWYIDRRSFGLDLFILIETLKIMFRNGASH